MSPNIPCSDEMWRYLNRQKRSPDDSFDAVLRRETGFDADEPTAHAAHVDGGSSGHK